MSYYVAYIFKCLRDKKKYLDGLAKFKELLMSLLRTWNDYILRFVTATLKKKTSLLKLNLHKLTFFISWSAIICPLLTGK